jgi:hypothetical protein
VAAHRTNQPGIRYQRVITASAAANAGGASSRGEARGMAVAGALRRADTHRNCESRCRLTLETACAPPQPLARILRELLSKFGDFFTGWRPVRLACVAVKHQRTGLQCFFEFFLTESRGSEESRLEWEHPEEALQGVTRKSRSYLRPSSPTPWGEWSPLKLANTPTPPVPRGHGPIGPNPLDAAVRRCPRGGSESTSAYTLNRDSVRSPDHLHLNAPRTVLRSAAWSVTII